MLIVNKCSARVKDKRGQLPLHRAAAVGSIPIIKILLEEGKSPVNATDMDGLTALHHAISEGHGDAAILLLKAGAEPDKRDSTGNLAIDLAPDKKVTIDIPSPLFLHAVDGNANHCSYCVPDRFANISCKQRRRKELNFLEED